MVHVPHKEGCSHAGEYLGRVHIDIPGPMQVKLAGGKEYEYIVVDDHTRAVYTRRLRKRWPYETIRIWNAETGSAVGKPLEGHTGWVESKS